MKKNFYAFLEHEVGSSCTLNLFLHFIIVLKSMLISLKSSAVHYNLRLHSEFFLYKPIEQLCSTDGNLIILHEVTELDIIGQSGSLHAGNILVNTGGEQAIQGHPSVNHLAFMHFNFILAMNIGGSWVAFLHLRLAQYLRPLTKTV